MNQALTGKALKTVAHPYRQALEQEFGLDRLRVMDIGEVTQLCPQDIGRKAIIVVGTLASLRVEDKDVRSSKDAEQLLGRVLRMPFAQNRQIEALNRAYAHLASPSFSQAAQLLKDKLIDMGFEAMEVAALVRPGSNQGDLFGGQDISLSHKKYR